MAYVSLVLILIFFSFNVEANSCCGQSPASFTVLSQSQRFNLNTSISYLRSQGRVYSDSDQFFTWSDKKREVRSLLLNAAGVLSEGHQVFINTALMEGQYSDPVESGKSSNLADTLIGYSYEVLPEYSFSYWKPVIFITGFLNVPTGNSIYDGSTLSEGTDVTGHNQWGAGLGLTARKVYFPVTITLQARTIRLFSKQFENVRVSDFYDSSLAFLTSYSSQLWNLRFNGGLAFNHLSERRLEPSQTTSETTQNFTVLAGLQKSISDSWVAGIHYADQTLIGAPKNSILNRSLTINFSYTYL